MMYLVAWLLSIAFIVVFTQQIGFYGEKAI